MDQAMQLIELSKIKPSKTNPRKNFSKRLMDELIQSVSQHGVLMPVLLRPIGEDGEFELVAGERRFRAAKAAGLETIPATVRKMYDRTALEFQVIENLQREDLHPLEEAAGYEAILKNFGTASVEDIAIKVGKSKAYVYGRMKLCELVETVREAFFQNKITPSIALLIARLPSSVQESAADHISKYAPTYDEAHNYIINTYMLMLSQAPFSTKDAGLCPDAGACTTCKKRSGNQSELFSDVGKDMCLDPSCFAEKKQASWLKKAKPLADKGYSILPLERRGRFKDWEHYDLNESVPDDKKGRSFKEMLDTLPPENLVVVPDDRGNPQVKVKRSVAAEHLKALGSKLIKHELPITQEDDADKERERLLIAEVESVLFDQILLRITPEQVQQALAMECMEVFMYDKRRADRLFKLLDITSEQEFIDKADKLTTKDIMTVLLFKWLSMASDEAIHKMGKELGVDMKQVRRTAMQNIKEREKSAKEAAKGAKHGTATDH